MSSCLNCKNFFSLSKKLKLTKFVANRIAFAPPKEKSYELICSNQHETQKVGSCYRPVTFKHSIYPNDIFPWIEIECFSILKSNKRSRIIVLKIINKNVSKRDKNTILFSHGNSSDLGTQFPFLVDLATQMKSDVICYDYSGYGKSEGNSSEKEILSDIEEVLDFVNQFYEVPTNKIIIMGFSLGSVPSIHIASKHNLKCLILIAPLASGIKIINKNLKITTCELEKIDIFCNIGKISDINSPIFLIHGQADQTIPISHSYEIFKKVKNANTWFPKKADHNDIFSKYRRKFYEKFNVFLEKVEIFHSENNKVSYLPNGESLANLDTDDLFINNKLNNKNFDLDSFKEHIENGYPEFNNTGLSRLDNIYARINRQENNLMLEKEYNKMTFGKFEEEEEDEMNNTPSFHGKDSNSVNGIKHSYKNKYFDLLKAEEIETPEKENCNSIVNCANMVNSNNVGENPFDEYDPNDTNYNFYCNDDRLSNVNNYDFKNAQINYRNSADDSEKNGSY